MFLYFAHIPFVLVFLLFTIILLGLSARGRGKS
jgi:hypothetical protein